MEISVDEIQQIVELLVLVVLEDDPCALVVLLLPVAAAEELRSFLQLLLASLLGDCHDWFDRQFHLCRHIGLLRFVGGGLRLVVLLGVFGAAVGFGDGGLESALLFGQDEGEFLLLLQFGYLGLLLAEQLLCPVLDGDVSSSLLLQNLLGLEGRLELTTLPFPSRQLTLVLASLMFPVLLPLPRLPLRFTTHVLHVDFGLSYAVP